MRLLKAASLSAKSRAGKLSHSLTLSDLPDKAIANLASGEKSDIQETSSIPFENRGLKAALKIGNRQAIESFLVPQNGKFSVFVSHSDPIAFPKSYFLGGTVKGPPQENARRFSEIVKRGEDTVIVEPLRVLMPNLQGFFVLNGHNGAYVMANCDGEAIPVNLLGEGFSSLFDVLLGIAESKGGCIFLDEVDNRLHYSVVEKFWQVISVFASQNNCQVFSTSHSQETILSALEGVKKSGRTEDFQYLRLENETGRHFTEPYNADELLSSKEFNFEFR